MIKLLPFVFMLLIAACSSAQDQVSQALTGSEIYEKGRYFAELFYSNDLDSLNNFLKIDNYSMGDLKQFRKKVEDTCGDELEVIKEYIYERGELPVNYIYIRFSRFSKPTQPVKTVFAFDSENNIGTYSVETQRHEAYSRFLDYQTKTNLILPFEGEWYAGSAGRTIVGNNHAAAPDQRFASDYIILDGRRLSVKDGSSNKHYYCFGKNVIAPGDGVIVDVVNKKKDNIPGDMPDNPGNFVIIDHENGEYSFLAHFKYRSIVVKKGDRVSAGDLLGSCGNSGHSSAPHIHYHLQNSPVWFEGEGLPAQFQNIYVDGVLHDRAEPDAGQVVSNSE